MIKKCYAKINLTLDSLYKREDKYHEIDSLMTRISLYDEMEVTPNDLNELRIFGFENEVCEKEDNLIYKAWLLLKDRVKDNGIDVKIKKNIPIAAGLAGGTSDGAETLKALNEMWSLNLSNKELMEISKPLGADFSFFFMEKSARARGIGEILDEININLHMPILLINDGTEISSASIYKKLGDFGHIDNEIIIDKLKNGKKEAIYSFENVMETVALEMHPHLRKIKEELENSGALKTLMSGSGASIFAVFDNEEDLDKAFKKFKNRYKFVEKVSLIDD